MRDEIRETINQILKDENIKVFDEFLQRIQDAGFEIKRGKHISIKGKNQKRYIRLRSLGEGYTEDDLKKILAGEMERAFEDSEKVEKQPKVYQRKNNEHEFDLLIDIQKKLVQGKGQYYVRFAKNFNTKQVAKADLFLKQHDIRSYDALEKKVRTAVTSFNELSASIKKKEKRLAEIQVLKTHIINYVKTKDVYADYRKCGYSKYFRLGKNLNQRDTIAVRRMVDGYLKLLYPDGVFTKEEVAEVLEMALEMRRRVKEQLKKLGGMEFYDVNFSYIDTEDLSEHYVAVPEQGGGKLIPEGMCNPGQVYTVSHGKSDMIGVFRLEFQMLAGNGKFDRTGLGSDRECKEAVDTAFNFLKANGNRISGSLGALNKDFIINYQDLQGLGMTKVLALPTLIALCSIALGKTVQSSMAVLGDFSIGGTILKVENLASTLQVCLDSGAKKVLLPQTSAVDLGTVPAELMSSFSLVFYQSAEDAVFKALGVE